MEPLDGLAEPFARTRRRKLVVSAAFAVLVGVWVALLTRNLTGRVCPLPVPTDPFRIREVTVDHLYVEIGRCVALVPLAPTYAGLAVLTLPAVWLRR
ncbi:MULTISPECIES: hypothetical protein [Halorussus]|uniref:hypothetical protein n=1 Tax=Halorussus TaxID=1070314 RepID=UPI00209E55FA|nr:hypothetical protein [Halorussus vallis]USZ77241.1 hypothetical protein NGM07_07895 [Halorussus vallis]